MLKLGEVFDEIRREGEERGIRLGEERGIRLGEERMLLANIRAVIKNMSLTAQQRDTHGAQNCPALKALRYE